MSAIPWRRLGHLLFLGVFVVVVLAVDPALLWLQLQLLPAALVILFGAMTLLVYLLKAWRFYLLRGAVGYRALVRVTIYHNFFLNLLPMRLGEAAYLQSLKRHQVAYSRSLADLMLVRSLDLLVLLLLFLLVVPFELLPVWLSGLGVVTLLFALLASRPLARYAARRLEPDRQGWQGHLAALAQERLRISTPRLLGLGLMSVLIWGVALLMWLPLLQFYLSTGAQQALFAALVAVGFTLLPLNPPAGLGSVESGWVLGLGLLNTGLSEAAQWGLLAHALQLSWLALITAGTYLLERVMSPQK